MNAQPNSFAGPPARAAPSDGIDGGGASFGLEVFDKPSEIEREWRQLEASGIATVFQRYDWIEAYVRHVLPHDNMQASIVLGRLGGRPAFILPLATRKTGPVRIATWIGGKHAAYNFGLWSSEAAAFVKTLPRAGIVRMLATALGDLDCAVLERMPRIHGGVVQPLGALPRTAMSNEGYPFDLTGGFDAVLGQRKGSPRRKRTRRKERRMREAGELRYLMTPGPEQEREALEFFFDQKALRLSEQGKPNSFDQPGVKDFYRDLLKRSRGMPEPVLEIATLAVGGKIRAVTGSGVHRGHVNSYFTAFALDELAQHSPGNILTHRHIEDCCKRGMSMYDLGIGYEDYKTHWCEDALPLDDGYAAFTPRGAATVALIRIREEAKNRMRGNRLLWRHLKTAQARFSRQPLAMSSE